MANEAEFRNVIRPINVGNVITNAFALYRSHLGTYLRISLTATLWVLLPIILLATLIPLGIVAIDRAGLNSDSIVMIAVVVGVLGTWGLFYCSAKYLLNAALISRLAFFDFTNQPESVQTARNYLQPRLWSFLRVTMQVIISLYFLMVGLYILLMIAVFALAFLIAGISTLLGINSDNPIGVILLGLVVTVLSLAAIVFILYAFLWYFSRWMVAEVPLAVESEVTGGKSVVRSWQLTKGSVNRILMVASIAFLVTLPIVSMTNIAPTILLVIIRQGSPLYWAVYAISVVLSFASGIFILPFWQTIKAVLYCDLRSRREGLGLQLRDRE